METKLTNYIFRTVHITIPQLLSSNNKIWDLAATVKPFLALQPVGPSAEKVLV